MSGFMEGYVYFIGCPGMDAVKVGYTACNPAKRLAALQTGNPSKLELLLVIDGDPEWERAIHDQCKEDRLQGEWFTMSGKIGQFMEVMRYIYKTVDGTDGSVRWHQ